MMYEPKEKKTYHFYSLPKISWIRSNDFGLPVLVKDNMIPYLSITVLELYSSLEEVFDQL